MYMYLLNNDIINLNVELNYLRLIMQKKKTFPYHKICQITTTYYK